MALIESDPLIHVIKDKASFEVLEVVLAGRHLDEDGFHNLNQILIKHYKNCSYRCERILSFSELLRAALSLSKIVG